jgi:hypothetical protein
MNNWEEVCIELCTDKARRGTVWWKIGIWRLKGVRRNSEHWTCTMCSKEEDWSHIFGCEGKKIRRNRTFDSRFRNVDAEIGIGGYDARIESSGR